MAANTQALPQPDGISRRNFLKKAAIGAAVAAGLGATLQKKVLGKAVAVEPLRLPEDSIFTPRADQRVKVTGGK